MLFNSLEFFVFFPLVVVVYFLLPFRFRALLLVVASYIFYMCWRWEYAFLLLTQTGINLSCGKAIVSSENSRVRFFWLACAICASLAVLFLFKYYHFFLGIVGSLSPLVAFSLRLEDIPLAVPVGLSFYTLQALGYTIDVYQKRVAAERNPINFALFVAFFPQLLSGPIERAGNMLKQFRQKTDWDWTRVHSGAVLFLWGLFKKIVIADRLAVYVNLVYSDPQGYSGPTLLLATYFFAFQIYCDFSGYSDMAIGIARIFGYDLMINFRLPYFAESISDFWRRWHIALSTWFRDYLYIPLGGNRTNLLRWHINIMIVFATSGLWHGANWTFVIWGMLHGFYYLVEWFLEVPGRLFCSLIGLRGKLLKVIKILITFHLVTFAWIFFKARSLDDAIHVIEGIFTTIGGSLYLGPSQITTLLGVLLIILLTTVQFFQYRGIIPFMKAERSYPLYIRWPVYMFLIFVISIFGMSSNDFIYFQF